MQTLKYQFIQSLMTFFSFVDLLKRQKVFFSSNFQFQSRNCFVANHIHVNERTNQTNEYIVKSLRIEKKVRAKPL